MSGAPKPISWNERCAGAERVTAILRSKIAHVEWQPGWSRGAGSRILADGLRDLESFGFEPDPTGRHKMKRVYYALSRLVMGMLRLWSRPAQWFDSNYWVKTDEFGTGLGAAVGMRMLRAEGGLLNLMREDGDDCPHSRPDRLAAARLCCSLCLNRQLMQSRQMIRMLHGKLEDLQNKDRGSRENP